MMARITYKKSSVKTRIIELANVALMSRLYVNGWSLYPTLYNIVNNNGGCTGISIAFSDGEPVGICVMIPKYGLSTEPNSMTFVRKSYRRMGIGTYLIKNALGKCEQFFWQRGNDASVKFFEQISNAMLD